MGSLVLTVPPLRCNNIYTIYNMNSLHILFTLFTTSVASQVRNVYWNTTTASFSEEPKTVLVNEGNLPWEYDQVNIICPVYKPGTSEGEQHIIYSVEKEEFDNCRVTSPRPRIVAICNRPQTFMYFTITFRSFTPTPGGLEFRPGQDYYFISTSNKKDIHRRVGGWCSSHNMKMVFKMAENEVIAENKESTTTLPIPTPAAFWSKYWNAQVPSQNENYVYDKPSRHYQQTKEDTYFRQYNSDIHEYQNNYLHGYEQRLLDESVDIRIVASAYSSSSLVTESVLLVLSTVLLLCFSR